MESDIRIKRALGNDGKKALLLLPTMEGWAKREVHDGVPAIVDEKSLFKRLRINYPNLAELVAHDHANVQHIRVQNTHRHCVRPLPQMHG